MQTGATILSFLASVALRSLVLFAAAALALTALRVKSAAGRHAAWTAVMLGMFVLPFLEPVLPPLPIRVLKPAPAAALALPDVPAVALPAAPLTPQPAPRMQYTWGDAAVAVYLVVALILLARLAVSYLFTRRLLRAATPLAEAGMYESSWISVPMTAGRRILLPADWPTWPAAKLEAVLAHERQHIARADWLISLSAAANRAIFWFHPLAWFLERRLAALAEHACDDAALLVVPPAPYAQALLDMAAAVKTTRGRLMWEAMAMAKAAEVQKRIERALDETREIPRPWTARRWMTLAACAVPVLWLAAVAQLAPATAQEQPKAVPMASTDTSAAERAVAANPNDLDARAQLILAYYAKNQREPRLVHIYWMIANHPEASQTLFVSRGLTPRDSALNTAVDYQRALGLWRQAAASATNPAVVRNAAEFIGQGGDPNEVERILLNASSRWPENPLFKMALGKLYATAVLGSMGDPSFPNTNPSFAMHARTELDNTDNRQMLTVAGNYLSTAGQHVPAAVDYGHQLMQRSGVRVVNPDGSVVGGVPAGVRGGVPGGVLGGIVGSVPAGGPPPQGPSGGVLGGVVASIPSSDLPPAPPAINNVQPDYPPLAIQARISGIIRCKVTIATDGSVRNIQILSGHPLLVPSALEAVKETRFQPPATQGDYLVEIPFKIDNLSPDAIAGAGDLSTRQTKKAKVVPDGPKTIVIGSNVQASKLVYHPDPLYPAEARAAGIEGTVTIKVTVAENGTVEDAQATDGNPALAPAALDALRQWTYKPTLLNGEPVKVITTVVVPFHL